MKLNKFLFVLLLFVSIHRCLCRIKTLTIRSRKILLIRGLRSVNHTRQGLAQNRTSHFGNPTEAHTVIRVGLSFTTFTSTGAVATEMAGRHFAVAQISHTVGTVRLIDESTGKQIIALDTPGTIVTFTRDADGYHVSIGGVEIGTYAGGILLQPTDPTNQFRVENIRRVFSGTFVPSYRACDRDRRRQRHSGQHARCRKHYRDRRLCARRRRK